MRFLLGFFVALIVIGLGVGAAIYLNPQIGARLQTADSQATTPVPSSQSPAPLRPTLTQAPAGNGAPAPGAPAQPAPPQPKVVASENIEDWLYTCLEPPGESPVTVCGISQQIATSDTRQVVFLWRISQDGKGGFVSVWQTPTDILVSRGLTIEAGTPEPLVIPFDLCTTRGCQAGANVEPGFLDLLAKAEQATAKVTILNGRQITINVSVKGLAAALEKLRAQ